MGDKRVDDAGPDLHVRRRELLVGSGAMVAVGAMASVAQAAQGGVSSLSGAAKAYVSTDKFFGRPVIFRDEARELPQPHRLIIGGFDDNDTRYAFYFPEKSVYKGRFIQFLQGGPGGTEPGALVQANPDPANVYSQLGNQLGLAVSLGAYLVESNQGHIGTTECRKAGQDASIYGWRASAESARFGKYLAQKIYGQAPHHGYVYGGSGGARRSVNCAENGGDVWAGALPFMGGGPVELKRYDPKEPAYYSSHAFGTLFNVQRMLRDKLHLVIDAVEPGGGGNPFEHLNQAQSEALTELYELGFPRGQEFMIAYPAGQIGAWAWNSETLIREDPGYWTDFWSKPGYVGHDSPHLVKDDLIDTEVVVKKLVTAREMAARVAAGAPEAASPMAQRGASLPPDMVLAIEFEKPKGYLLGSSMKLASGRAAGRQLWVVGDAGDSVFCDGIGQAGNLKYRDVAVGDRIKLDNRHFLAYCYFARHHISRGNTDQWRTFTIDDRPIYPQRSAVHHKETLFGPNFTAAPKMKVFFVQHTHDSSIWPGTAIRYVQDVNEQVGGKGADIIQLRWVQYAEHGGPPRMPMKPAPAARLINSSGHIEQNLHDLVAWVEEGKRPAVDTYTYTPNGAFIFPATAAERGGIQPVVHAKANGGVRADVKVGQPVTFTVAAEVPKDAGAIVSVEWDFEGLGAFPLKQPGIDGRDARVEISTTYAFSKPGTYFPVARVTSHRDGDVNSRLRRVNNLGRTRVVVT